MSTGQQEQARPMRQRMERFRARSMARRSEGEGRFMLSPRARQVAGWLAALLLVLGIAAVVRFLGGNGDGAPIAGPSGSAGAVDDGTAIDFGTAIDDATGEVADGARTEHFGAGDTFAYSVAASGEVPAAVYVEVRRTGGGEIGVAQEPVEAQQVPDPRAIAFTVPADDLLAVFGAGEYLMLIYTEPTDPPIAEGTFELVAKAASPSTSAAASTAASTATSP